MVLMAKVLMTKANDLGCNEVWALMLLIGLPIAFKR